MKRYRETVLKPGTGLGVQGASIMVHVANLANPGSGVPATLYSADEAIPANVLANPVYTDSQGEFWFYVPNGSYDLVVTRGSTTEIYPNTEIFDFDMIGETTTASIAQIGEARDAALVDIGSSVEDYLVARSVPQPLPYAATLTVDVAQYDNYYVTLTGNAFLDDLVNVVPGRSGRFRVTQDNVGGRNLTFGENWFFPYGAKDLSDTPGKVDVIKYFVHVDGTVEAEVVNFLSSSYPFTDVLPIGGDSNGLGRGTGVRASYVPTADIQIYNPVTNTLQTYTPGTNSGVTFGPTVNGQWGTEAQFAEDYKAAFPGRKLVIVKAGYDGTTLDVDWAPGGGYYLALKGFVTAAKALIAAAGQVAKVAGGVIHLSTNDANNLAKANAFQANMTARVPSFRADLQIPDGAPLLWVRVKPVASLPYYATVLAAQNAVAAALPSSVKLIQSNDVAVDSDGDIHPGAFGHALLGNRAFDAIFASYILADGAPTVLNGNFAAGIFNWQNYAGAAGSWDAGGQQLAIAAAAGQVIGWMGNLTLGTTYIVDYDASGIVSGDLQLSGTSLFGVNRASNVSILRAGIDASFGFIANNSSNSIYINRVATAGGIAAFDNFTIRAATVGAAVAFGGDFSSGTGWTFTNAAIAGNALVVNSLGGGTFATRTIPALVAGGVYLITVTISAWTSGQFSIYLEDPAGYHVNLGGFGGAVGTASFVVNANGAADKIYLQSAYQGTIDEIKIERLT